MRTQLPLLRGVALAAGFALLAFAALAPGAAARPAGSHGAPAHRPAPGLGRYYPPEIQVFADPYSEHWPANYLPDSYYLHGYDGTPDSATVCAGHHARSWSTGGGECPPGQQPAQPARQWSTQP